MLLPKAGPKQQYVSVAALAGGHLTLPESSFVDPSDPNARKTVPSLSFLVTRPGSGEKILFDLGLRKDTDRYPSVLQQHITNRQPMYTDPCVLQTIESAGIKSSDISEVILSHVHYDHHGDPDMFPTSKFLVGHGALDVLENGLPGRGSHSHFEAGLFNGLDAKEFSPASSAGWKPLGPFPATHDLFGDGSVYVVDAPGHLPGHVNLLCRLAEQKWVYLAGDSYHDLRLLTGEKKIGTWSDDTGHVYCIHVDKELAAENIERIQTLKRDAEHADYDVEIIAAHDVDWYEKAKAQNRLFPQTL